MAIAKARTPWGVILTAGAAALAVLASLYFLQPRPQPGAPLGRPESAAPALPAGCVLNPGKEIGGPISLIDQTGAAVTESHFSDGVTLIYFGYTFCPDVCPLSLQAEKRALDKLGNTGQVVQPVIITLDPERDTPQVLASYVRSNGFPTRLIGLTGSQEQVAAAAKAFRVAWQKVADPQSPKNYTLGHGSYFYLLDDEWRLRALFPSTLSPDDAAQCIRAGLRAADQPP